MQIKLTTWNINSVRLRIELVAASSRRSSRTCSACRRSMVDEFPMEDVKRLGFDHVTLTA